MLKLGEQVEDPWMDDTRNDMPSISREVKLKENEKIAFRYRIVGPGY